ncbi:MAG: hypothetical protein HC817_02330 [Saprospiraceae bacterium]|nr:hypothetical protein [Saprospiraceae bacterium]
MTWFDNTTGNRARSFEVFNHGYTFQNTGLFGKGNGLGDAAAACQLAPISIGNRVWLDCDADGVQDADEKGLADVKVFLLDSTCQIVASQSTNTEGVFSFDNLLPHTRYFLRLGENSDLQITY